MVTSVSNTTTASTTAASRPGTDAGAMQDRFLKLLVAQVNNQDPLNPMDNAQMTTQMAQINTVNGIQQVNETLTGMVAQLASMQVLQGTSLVGHDVLTAGNGLHRDATGVATGAVDLSGAADSVKVDIYTPGGQLLDTLKLGPQSAGRVDFQWNAASYQGSGVPVYRITALRNNQAVAATALSQDRVTSVGTSNGALSVQLQNGSTVGYSDIVAIR